MGGQLKLGARPHGHRRMLSRQLVAQRRIAVGPFTHQDLDLGVRVGCVPQPNLQSGSLVVGSTDGSGQSKPALSNVRSTHVMYVKSLIIVRLTHVVGRYELAYW